MKFVFVKRVFFSMLLPAFLLAGCCQLGEEKTVAYRVVEQVNVTYDNGMIQTQRKFYKEENIHQILSYLRYIDPYGRPREDPEQVAGRDYYITVFYSDGSEQKYHQRDDRFFRVGDGPWKRIDSQKALYLSGILGMMITDLPPASENPPPLMMPHL